MSEPADFSTDYAQSIVRLQAEGKSFDRDICEREPIRTPGAIQPHGALIGLAAGDVIAIASQNISDFFGADAAEVIGRSARDFLPDALLAKIEEERAAGLLSAINPACFSRRLPLRLPCACWVHHRGELTYIELENVSAVPDGDAGHERIAERALGAMRDADDIETLDAIVLQAIRDLGGYERALVYRFDGDWNGVTTAENMREGAYRRFWACVFLPPTFPPRPARSMRKTCCASWSIATPGPRASPRATRA